MFLSSFLASEILIIFLEERRSKALERLSELYFLMCNEIHLAIFHSKQYFKDYCAQVELVCGFIRFYFFKVAFFVYVAISPVKENMIRVENKITKPH